MELGFSDKELPEKLTPNIDNAKVGDQLEISP